MSSAAESASVRVALPSAFSAGNLAPPPFQSPRLALEQWRSARAPSGELALAWSCAGGDASSWSADATELANGKLAELASGTAARLRNRPTPMHVVATTDAGRERTLEGEGALARTFVAFTAGRAHGCFVVCASDADACRDAVRTARVEGELVAPPPPGWALRSLSLAVHHPDGALAGLVALVVAGAALAVLTRPKPKSAFRG